MRAITTLTLFSVVIAVHSFAPCQQSPVHNARLTTATAATALSASPFDVFSILKEGKVGIAKSLAGDYDEDAVKRKLDNLVKKNPVLMLSFTTCRYCAKAKQLLDEKSAKYTVIEIDKEEDGKALRAVMGSQFGRTSVPAIWIKGTYIGGFNDGPSSEFNGLNSLNMKGELDGMLKYVPKTKHTTPR
mmetsp:Transcript_34194/g.72856  ORF Transcript_34194/g.72856 Transcript_34194/m.72856 type:complete len:187 (-) Transcript_34194:247-807(-)